MPVCPSHREEAVEELAVALEGNTKLLRRGLFASSPLRLEARTRVGETAVS